MKIAFLNIYNGKVERGSEIFVSELASRLSANHHIDVYQTGERKIEAYNTYQIKGVAIIAKQAQDFFYHLSVFLFTIKCLPSLWKHRYDWIVPINGRWQVLIIRIFRFFSKCKILISGHAGIGKEDKINLIIGKPDVFVALSKDALLWSREITFQRKAVYIPNGIDTNKFHPRIPSKKINLTSPIIICVSALLAYKRIDLLISAVKKLNNSSLLLIGDGPLREQIVKDGRQILGKRFLYIRQVNHDEIAGFYRACNLFSLPSKKSEAFGIVYLEALACNLPIVAPDDNKRRDIIGSAGLFCDVTNISEYNRVLEKAIKKDFGDNPRLQAEKFSWEVIVQKYEDVFEKN